ncbi:hypothetical protein COL5a_002220 [Colletotrichum fioriniae]|uniref:uncharacterized protein n=1 Tax=Colletotrichum fioriniae TaxID=710243 RepID=UPI002301DC11|nr:uncharacterized protein COL516b_002072 [Colletotrichum fioriniae]KAJ0311362.1 hypothetical protein COL516b_002072 [Colletotrichum fioriniae]KAJ0331558.1 hypothetical protein COL5a_002220 [Colletotrichum fioriniae]KAJ3941290.1 hypothetical protein N0V96_009173 [Colletotrichum fioriniae]
MRFSIVFLALSGGASALPALNGFSARQPVDLLNSRSVEFKGSAAPALVDDMSLSRVETVTARDAEEEDEAEEGSAATAATKTRSLDPAAVEPRQAKPSGSGTAKTTKTTKTSKKGDPRVEAIGDNKVNPTTGLTDSEAAEIVTGLDLKDKKAPGSIDSKGKRIPLPGLSADETDAIVKQGQAALKDAGA